MREVINSYNKTINLDNQDPEVIPFDPKAAQKARERRVAEYKAEYPDAVDDLNKAYAMAKVGDKYEREAADKRAQGNYGDAKIIQSIADTVEEVAGEDYDKRNGKSNPQQKAG